MKAIITIALFLSLNFVFAQTDSACVRLQLQYDSLVTDNAKLKTKFFIASYKIEKVRYYLNICLKNKSQDKFLKGWVRRAIE